MAAHSYIASCERSALQENIHDCSIVVLCQYALLSISCHAQVQFGMNMKVDLMQFQYGQLSQTYMYNWHVILWILLNHDQTDSVDNSSAVTSTELQQVQSPLRLENRFADILTGDIWSIQLKCCPKVLIISWYQKPFLFILM